MSVLNRILSEIVRIYAYRVIMYRSNVLLLVDLNFESSKKLDVHLTDPVETIRTATNDCVYDTHSYG